MSVKQCKGYENIAIIHRSTELALEQVFLYVTAKTSEQRLEVVNSAHGILLQSNPANIKLVQDLPRKLSKNVCKMFVEFNMWIRCQLRNIKNIKTKEDHLKFLEEYAVGMSKYFLMMGVVSKYFT
jgi:hypothetical protein